MGFHRVPQRADDGTRPGRADDRTGKRLRRDSDRTPARHARDWDRPYTRHPRSGDAIATRRSRDGAVRPVKFWEMGSGFMRNRLRDLHSMVFRTNKEQMPHGRRRMDVANSTRHQAVTPPRLRSESHLSASGWEAERSFRAAQLDSSHQMRVNSTHADRTETTVATSAAIAQAASIS